MYVINIIITQYALPELTFLKQYTAWKLQMHYSAVFDVNTRALTFSEANNNFFTA